MADWTHDKAVQILSESDDLADLAEAVAYLADDPETKPEELLPALERPGYVAEQAALALRRRAGGATSGSLDPVDLDLLYAILEERSLAEVARSSGHSLTTLRARLARLLQKAAATMREAGVS